MISNIKKSLEKKMLKKFIAMFLIAVLLLVRTAVPLAVVAQTLEAPTAPSAPSEPENTSVAPVAPSQPTPPPKPTLPETPSLSSTVNSLDSSQSSGSDEEPGESGVNESGSAAVSSPSQSLSSDGTGSQNQDGQSGPTTITTGDADNFGNLSTYANSNISLSPSRENGGGSGITVVNSENGTNSDNYGSVLVSDESNTTQNNNANVGNNLYQKTTTGDNSASKNTGGDNTIVTGDANTTGTILTAVNTNLDGVAVYEFNVVDNQTGNYILDFSKANCISGCLTGDTKVINTGNGADSVNSGNVDTNSTDNTSQINDAAVLNNLTLTSDSGDNKADMNTNGNNSITTGDANVSGSVVNMVNNNIAGGVVYAVVNIFGDLIGDIVLPDGTVLSCCLGNATAMNSGNGAGSTNDAKVSQSTNNTTTQFNNVDIQNNVILDSQTGDNDVNKNTTGTNSVTTGDTNILAQVFNVANTNIVGGNWWLVLVNEAGFWIGKIIGAPDGQNYSGSDGFEFSVDPSGEVTVVNSGNGAGSENSGNVSQTSNTNIYQSNDAKVVNNVNLKANTGDNSANMNTGGNSAISTGDANIIANIVNFVNNNIVGGGKLIVTVVNVFGSWLGDFVGPGQSKSGSNQPEGGIGGVGQQHSLDNSTGNDSHPEDNLVSKTLTTNLLSLNSVKSNPKSDGVTSLELNSVLGDSDSSQEMAVASDKVLADGKTSGRKVVKINLAYPVLFAGIGLLLTAILKKKKILNLLPNRRKNVHHK